MLILALAVAGLALKQRFKSIYSSNMYACVNISAADRFCCITDMCFVFIEYSEICKAVLMLHG